MKNKEYFTYISKNLLYNKFPEFSSKDLFLSKMSKGFYLFLLFIFCIFFLNATIAVNFFIFTGSCIYIINITFKIILTFARIFAKNKVFYKNLDNNILPIYSILVPLYKEDNIISFLIESLKNLDYPSNKLEILLLVEEDDKLTNDAIELHNLQKPFKTIKIPFSEPRTKPKACNYGLNFAKGKYITIYDAEDIPDPYQLKKVVKLFNNLNDDVICIQAKLNYFNREENFLSKCFSIEYSNWFEYMLPSLYYFNFIIPLGGTSNHIKKDKLIEIGGWDPYNITEDAELGIRINFFGYKTALLNSTTLEESPITLKSWIPQRTRWIKGYLQTYILTLKNSRDYLSKMPLSKSIAFHLFFGFPVISYLMIPILFLISFLSIIGAIDTNYVYNYNIFLWKIGFITGIIFSVFTALSSIIYHKWLKTIDVIFVFPFYWVLHSMASYRAIYQLFKKRYYWEKTPHGLTKYKFNLNLKKFTKKEK